MRTKYLILDNVGGVEAPIISPNFEQHEDVARKYGGKHHVVAAGFVAVYSECNELAVHCGGRSDSLDMESRGDIDAAMIKRMLEEY